MELVIENADRALSMAAAACGVEVIDYTAAPIFMGEKIQGSHEWVIEFKTPPSDLEQFTTRLDESLKSLNSDYEAKRYKNMTMLPPKINVAKEGLFYQWLAGEKKLGGQHKIPRLSNERKFVEHLLSLNA